MKAGVGAVVHPLTELHIALLPACASAGTGQIPIEARMAIVAKNFPTNIRVSALFMVFLLTQSPSCVFTAHFVRVLVLVSMARSQTPSHSPLGRTALCRPLLSYHKDWPCYRTPSWQPDGPRQENL